MNTPSHPDDETVRLDAQTIRFQGPTVHHGGGPDPSQEFDSATALDPLVWPTPPAGPVLRSGPGVPAQTAAAWHGTDQPVTTQKPHRRRRTGCVLLPVILLLLVAFLWDRHTAPITLAGVTVRADPDRVSCDGTAIVAGTLTTDGGNGTVTYHWLRSDGTDSGPLTQQVQAGHHATNVVLRWTFQGKGSMRATATLDVVAPSQHTAAVTFSYRCR